MNEELELITRVFTDNLLDRSLDSLYLFGQTSDNEQSVLVAAGRFKSERDKTMVSIIDTAPISGYPGFDAWSGKLQDLGISEENIIGIPVGELSSLNTLIEAESLVRFARARGYFSLGITAAPFHQLRAFITTVSVAMREFPQLKLFSYPGVALPWNEEVAHSQGIEKGTRAEILTAEFERVFKYQNKGDILPFGEILNYLKHRDNVS